MSDDKKLHITSDHLGDYKKGVAARAAEMRKQRTAARAPLPNLAQADAQYDPLKQHPTSLGHMGVAQKQVEDVTSQAKEGGLSGDTIAGLAALKSEMDAKMKNAPAPAEAPESPKEEPEHDIATPAPAENSEATRKILENMDSLEFDRRLDAIQQDVINNKDEKAATEARLEKEGIALSLEQMITEGVCTQAVPIAQNFRVTFRTVSPAENRAIRMLLWTWVDKEPRLEGMAADLYGMMLVVAAVSQIGTNKLPEHLRGDSFYSSEFDEKIFEQKFNLLSHYPAPMIHAIGVHANWFDERVRKMFTSEAIKGF